MATRTINYYRKHQTIYVRSWGKCVGSLITRTRYVVTAIADSPQRVYSISRTWVTVVQRWMYRSLSLCTRTIQGQEVCQSVVEYVTQSRFTIPWGNLATLRCLTRVGPGLGVMRTPWNYCLWWETTHPGCKDKSTVTHNSLDARTNPQLHAHIRNYLDARPNPQLQVYITPWMQGQIHSYMYT